MKINLVYTLRDNKDLLKQLKLKKTKLEENLTSEVSQFRWMNLDDSIKAIRPYNLERIQLLKNIENVLLKYSLIS